MANFELYNRLKKAVIDQYKAVPIAQIQRTGGTQTQTDVSPYWFSALRSIHPTAPSTYRPRVWPYIPGWNMIFTPREEDTQLGGGRIPFALLFRAADEWDLFSTAMETVIDKILSLDWQIRLKGDDPDAPSQRGSNKVDDPVIEQITDFLNRPTRIAGMDTFRSFGNKILTDMYIGDCATIWMEKNILGEIISATPIDGSQIKVLLDDTGRRPIAPDAAFQQIMYGFPATDFTEEDIIYAVRKPRNRTPYGRSHLEQILTWANIGIRAQRFLVSYYESGNTPEMLLPVDASVSPQKIAEWNMTIDSVMSGQDAERRKIKLIPSMTQDGKMQAIFPKEALLKTDLDEWLARIICFNLGLNPQAFVKAMNRASAESAQNQAEAEGQQPVIRWFEDVMNEVIRRFGYGDKYEFAFRVKRENDGLKQMQIDIGYLKSGVWCVNDVLRDLGMDEVNETWADEHFIETPQGAVPFPQVGDLMTAQINKLKAPAPTPQAPLQPAVPGAQGANGKDGGKPANRDKQAKVVQKTLNEVFTLLKAAHPEAKHAAEQLEHKLTAKLAHLQSKVETKLKAGMSKVDEGNDLAKQKVQLLYVARHGETPNDQLKVSSGEIDENLDVHGRAAAAKLRDELANVPLTAIYCGTLNRHKETADIVAQPHGIKPEIHPELDTWDTGDLAGQDRKAAHEQLQHHIDNPDIPIPNGESLNQFREDFRPFIKGLIEDARKNKGPRLVITSGSCLDEIGRILNNDMESLAIKPGGLISIQPIAKTKARGVVILGAKNPDDQDVVS